MTPQEEIETRLRAKGALATLEFGCAQIGAMYGSDAVCSAVLNLLGQIVTGTVLHHKPEAYPTDESRRMAIVDVSKRLSKTMVEVLAEHGIPMEFVDLSTPPSHN